MMTMKVSKEVRAEALSRLAECNKMWERIGGICYGDILSCETGKSIPAGYDRIHTACHSWVTHTFEEYCGVGQAFNYSGTYKKDAKDFLLLTCHNPEMATCSKEATQEIARWMADESPFSRFVLNKGAEGTKDGLIILCGPNGASLAEAMWMCKVLRYSVEGSKALETWLTLYKGGVNPMLAVLIATRMNVVKGATFGRGSVMGHCTVFDDRGNRRSGLPDLGKLLRGESEPNAESTSDLFVGPKSKDCDMETRIPKFVSKTQSDDGWGKAIVSNGCSKDNLIKQALEWEAEILAREGKVIPEKAAKAPSKKPTRKTVFLEDIDL